MAAVRSATSWWLRRLRLFVFAAMRRASFCESDFAAFVAAETEKRGKVVNFAGTKAKGRDAFRGEAQITAR
jgi:hypothetical protein